MTLRGLRVALGVTGGIAAYKSCELASLLKKEGAQVRCVLTQNACRFVSPLTFETLTGERCSVDAFDRAFEIEHIALAKWADVLLVAPATANFIGKLASGIADDLLSTVAMAMPAPIVLCPAMNSGMWRAPATARNVETVVSDGAMLIGPASGRLACGDEDVGRMEEPARIVRRLGELLGGKRDLEGRRVLVTAGPTREMLDPVRFLSNRSSGKMGYALAEAARDRGADVTLVSGPVSLAPPPGVELVRITSTRDLYQAVMERAGDCDVVVQAAAPADYRPAVYSEQKIKKTGGEMAVNLAPNPDVAAALGERKRPGQVLVAFAAETGDLEQNAQGKLLKKNADFVVANDVTQPGAGFEADTNRVCIVDAAGVKRLPLLQKRAVAEAIWDEVARRLGARDER